MSGAIVIPAIARDGSLFPIEKLRAHTDGVFHLAVSVFVFDGPDLLIQRRARGKYHCGGLWANTCCSHPHWNEGLAQCAARRLNEELGFSVPLTERRTVEYAADVGGGLHEHEKVTIFTGEASRDTVAIKPDPDEVMETRWVPARQLAEDVKANPADYTPWFRIYLDRFPDLTF